MYSIIKASQKYFDVLKKFMLPWLIILSLKLEQAQTYIVQKKEFPSYTK